MAAITFNAVSYAIKMKKAGMESNLADMQAEEFGNMINIMNDNSASTNDLLTMETALRIDINNVQNSLKKDINNVESSLKKDIGILEASFKKDINILELSLESKLKSFMVKSMITALGVLVTLQGFMTYFIKH